MKKIVFVICILFLIVGFSASANAVLLTDTTAFTATGTNATEDYISHGWGDVDFLDNIGDHVAWAHQYEFVPPAASINSAVLEITFWDDDRDRLLDPRTWEFGFGAGESWEWDIGAINAGAYTYDINVDYVGDGVFALAIASIGGDFGIAKSVLTIDYNAAPVPEPATMLLLGTGLVGLAVGSRKKFLKK